MTLPIMAYTRGCGQMPKLKTADKVTQEKWAKRVVALAALDIVLFISTLVLGALGASAVIHMPPAAAYALLGGSAAIGLAWLSLPLRIVASKMLNSKKNNSSGTLNLREAGALAQLP